MPFYLPPSFLPNKSFVRTFILSSLGFLSWLPPLFFLTENYYKLVPITGQSMYPYLNSQFHSSTTRDRVLLSVQRPWEGLIRGQLVAFYAPHDPEKIVVKRVVALPGDEVTTKKPYPKEREVVPSGYVWVEGDVRDRYKTMDSNYYGPISKSLLVGQLKAIVWPWGQRAWLRPEEWEQSDGRVRIGAHEAKEERIYGPDG